MTTAPPRHPGLVDSSRFDQALTRALELFDLTATDARWRGPRRREILRAREEFCRLFFSTTPSADSAPGLQRYFLYAAIAANRQRGAAFPTGGS